MENDMMNPTSSLKALIEWRLHHALTGIEASLSDLDLFFPISALKTSTVKIHGGMTE